MRVCVWYSEPIESAAALGGRMHATQDNVLLYAGMLLLSGNPGVDAALTCIWVLYVAQTQSANVSTGESSLGKRARPGQAAGHGVRRALKTVMRYRWMLNCTPATIDYGIQLLEMTDADPDVLLLPPRCVHH